jgi:hypothetical protein
MPFFKDGPIGIVFCQYISEVNWSDRQRLKKVTSICGRNAAYLMEFMKSKSRLYMLNDCIGTSKYCRFQFH